MKIQDERCFYGPCTIPAVEIDIGKVFSALIEGTSGIFIRAADCIVRLDNPENVWTQGEDVELCDMLVDDYQPLDVELVIKGNL